jgi:hypothetical protein
MLQGLFAFEGFVWRIRLEGSFRGVCLEGSFGGFVWRVHFEGSFRGFVSRVRFEGSFRGFVSRVRFEGLQVAATLIVYLL